MKHLTFSLILLAFSLVLLLAALAACQHTADGSFGPVGYYGGGAGYGYGQPSLTWGPGVPGYDRLHPSTTIVRPYGDGWVEYTYE